MDGEVFWLLKTPNDRKKMYLVGSVSGALAFTV
jgi:hypothetical protein